MSEHFIEPCIQGSEQQVEELIKWLRELSFKGVIIENMAQEKVESLQNTLSNKEEFLLFNRVTIDSPKRNPSDLDKFRNKCDFLVYYSINADLTKWACQDQRIDCLKFPLSEIHQLADDSTIIMAKENDKALEIDFSELLGTKNPIPWLRNIKKVIHRATKKELPIILSSNAKTEYDLRSRYSILGFLHFLEISESYYKDISQNWLSTKLVRNRERKRTNFVSPGIWVKESEEFNQ